MAISEAFTGSETVGTTEHSMTTDTAGPDEETSDGWFQSFLDLGALAAPRWPLPTRWRAGR